MYIYIYVAFEKVYSYQFIENLLPAIMNFSVEFLSSEKK